MENDQVRTRTAVTHFGKDGIMRSNMLPGAEETLADAQENFRVAVQLAGGRRAPLLVQMSAVKSQQREARSVKLLGAEVVLTGIRPEVAQTLVGLGADLQTIITCSTL